MVQNSSVPEGELQYVDAHLLVENSICKSRPICFTINVEKLADLQGEAETNLLELTRQRCQMRMLQMARNSVTDRKI